MRPLGKGLDSLVLPTLKRVVLPNIFMYSQHQNDLDGQTNQKHLNCTFAYKFGTLIVPVHLTKTAWFLIIFKIYLLLNLETPESTSTIKKTNLLMSTFKVETENN